MTNQEINERVAKLCGWVSIKPDDESNEQYWANTYQMAYSDKLPPYTQSLDACREFIDQIHGIDREDFIRIARELERQSSLYDFEHQWSLITMTPLELCEAFLRLKGQWE